jgi:hypothetical protein
MRKTPPPAKMPAAPMKTGAKPFMPGKAAMPMKAPMAPPKKR